MNAGMTSNGGSDAANATSGEPSNITQPATGNHGPAQMNLVSRNEHRPSGVPVEFRHACGRPGSHVVVRHLPVTISHAACDLTGVDVGTVHNAAGRAYVPPPK
jgi:hypothetical protein